jgi:hypothetical protein
MATEKKVPGDLGSQLVEEMRLQLNRLTVFVEAIQAAAVTDAATWYAAVAALTNQDDQIDIQTTITMPPAPRLDDGS